MSDVIEELSEENGELDRAHVERRLADWKSRISKLYETVAKWLPAECEERQDQTVEMHEEVMKRLDIPEARLPVLSVYRNGTWIGKLVPHGLWIIGANGRLNLFTATRQAIVVDRAENFQSPIWKIAPADDRRNEVPLTAGALLEALGL